MPLFRTKHDSSTAANGTVAQVLAEAAQLQAMEGYPLTAEEIAMFEIFKRGGSPERRHAHILHRIEDSGRVAAAE